MFLISIIIPCYNSARDIEQCILSIVAQTYSHLEILVVDDGSTDNGPDILKNIAARNARIKVLAQSNQGPSAARNLGLSHASGQYVLFVDADDNIMPTMVEEMLSVACRENADLVTCGYREIRPSGNMEHNDFTGIGNNPGKTEFITRVLSGTGGVIWGKFFRKAVIDHAHIRFDPNFRMCEDLLFNLSFIRESNRYAVLDRFLYVYNRCNESSITARLDCFEFQRQLKLQERIAPILASSGLPIETSNDLLARRTLGHLDGQVSRIVAQASLKHSTPAIQALRATILSVAESPYHAHLCPQDVHGRILLALVATRSPISLYFYYRIRLKCQAVRQWLRCRKGGPRP